MKKNTSWKFTDESSVTFQASVSGTGEFGLCPRYHPILLLLFISALHYFIGSSFSFATWIEFWKSSVRPVRHLLFQKWEQTLSPDSDSKKSKLEFSHGTALIVLRYYIINLLWVVPYMFLQITWQIRKKNIIIKWFEKPLFFQSRV